MRRSAVAVAAAALTLTACNPGSGEPGGDELTVLAAASLTEPFTTLAERFEDDHPGVTVRLAFDSSATLAEQVAQGAPADVLATADEETMQTAVDADVTEGDPRVFATNHLVLAVPPDNPAGIHSLADLADPGVTLVVCVESAPCGKLAERVLRGAGVSARPVSEEVDVKAVLGKVEQGEADAGLVYASDVASAADRVEQVDALASEDDVTRYPIAALTGPGRSGEPALARQWVELVLSERGRRALSDAGFGVP